MGSRATRLIRDKKRALKVLCSTYTEFRPSLALSKVGASVHARIRCPNPFMKSSSFRLPPSIPVRVAECGGSSGSGTPPLTRRAAQAQRRHDPLSIRHVRTFMRRECNGTYGVRSMHQFGKHRGGAAKYRIGSSSRGTRPARSSPRHYIIMPKVKALMQA